MRKTLWFVLVTRCSDEDLSTLCQYCYFHLMKVVWKFTFYILLNFSLHAFTESFFFPAFLKRYLNLKYSFVELEIKGREVKKTVVLEVKYFHKFVLKRFSYFFFCRCTNVICWILMLKINSHVLRDFIGLCTFQPKKL